MVPVCAILSLGVWSSISGTGPARGGAPLGIGARLFLANSNEKLFCEIMEPPWWFLDGSWWLLVSFRLFFKRLHGILRFSSLRWSPVAVVPVAFVSPSVLRRF